LMSTNAFFLDEWNMQAHARALHLQSTILCSLCIRTSSMSLNDVSQQRLEDDEDGNVASILSRQRNSWRISCLMKQASLDAAPKEGLQEMFGFVGQRQMVEAHIVAACNVRNRAAHTHENFDFIRRQPKSDGPFSQHVCDVDGNFRRRR